MAFDINVLVGQPSAPYADGAGVKPRGGRMGDLIVSEFRGKYGEANSRGMVYHFCTLVAGQTLPIFTNTAHTYGLRNPPGSGVVLELIRLELGYLSGTQAPGNVVWTTPPANAGVTATGSGGITVSTNTNGQSGQLAGAGLKPASKCQMLTGVTTVAPTVILRTLGLSSQTDVATNAGQITQWVGYNFDGTDLLYPGADILLACTVAAAVGVNVVNVIAMEVPFTPGT